VADLENVQGIEYKYHEGWAQYDGDVTYHIALERAATDFGNLSQDLMV